MKRPTALALILGASLLIAGSGIGAVASNENSAAPSGSVRGADARPIQLAVTHLCVDFGRANKCRTRWDTHNHTCVCVGR